ncbi:MAG: histone deacetylase [Candidatus Freyarchaeota archaeon]|nr:hypothetical protein [Candidatus Freyrarchaeum guaymaensis]
MKRFQEGMRGCFLTGGWRMVTGVFFHEEFKGKDWPVIGDKFASFPEVLGDLLHNPNVVLIEPKEVSEEILLKVHSRELVENLKRSWYRKGAMLSVGGCIEAAEKIRIGELENALVFDVAAGHHAGPSSAWGGTYVSCTGPVVAYMRETYGRGRYAIIDTDSHHGDGTRSIFMGDRDVLHVCFCSMDTVEDEGTKVDVNVGWKVADEEYLRLVEEEFIPRVRKFRPVMIIHLFGHDTCQGDYGDRGLTEEVYPKLARIVLECAEEVCDGRYLVITHGGSRRDVAERIFPEIVRVLAKL